MPSTKAYVGTRRSGAERHQVILPTALGAATRWRMDNFANPVVERAVEEARSWAQDNAEADAAERFVRALAGPQAPENASDPAWDGEA